MENVLGVDVGGTTIKAAIVNGEGRESGCLETPTRQGGQTAEAIADRIGRCIHRALESSEYPVTAIGIGVPGAVSQQGSLLALPNLPVLEEFPLRSYLASAFDLPVYIDNSANNAARAEFQFGAAKGHKDFVLVTLGTGVGGGLYVDSQLLAGATGYAGEVGHIKLVVNGRRCGCGGQGCWEAYGSTRALVANLLELIAFQVPSSLRDRSFTELDGKVILTAAAAGDPAAVQAFSTWCGFNAIGLSNLINIFNPSLCVISGGLSEGGDFLLQQIRQAMPEYVLPRAWAAVDVRCGALGGRAGRLGAAALALTRSREFGQ